MPIKKKPATETGTNETPPLNPEDLIKWFNEDPRRVFYEIEDYILTAQIAEDILQGHDKPYPGFGSTALRLITWGDANGYQSEVSKLYEFANWLGAFPPAQGERYIFPSSLEFRRARDMVALLLDRMTNHVRRMITTPDVKTPTAPDVKGAGSEPYDLVGEKDIANFMSLSVRTIRNYTARKNDPLPVYRIESCQKIHARKSEITAWQTRNKS
jgi:hypothetical protein